MATLNFGDNLIHFFELMGTIKRTFQSFEMMFILHETILKDYLWCNTSTVTLLRHCFEWLQHYFNIASTLC